MNSFNMGDAEAHLSAIDPRLAGIIAKYGPCTLRPRDLDPYESLLRTILYQQLAGAAASAIERRFYALYDKAGRPPSAVELLATPDEQLRAAGISRQKISYMRDLSEHALAGHLDFASLSAADDTEVTACLTAVKGLGEWSAHMFLMFQLGRPDVLPVGDLAVRVGMRVAYELEETPTPSRAREIGQAWTPYRSVGSWYMWRVTEPVVADL